VPLDLTDGDACGNFDDEYGARVTHVVYAAQYEAPGLAPGWFDEEAIARNGAMLTNLMTPLLSAGGNLEHVSLLQESKAYGMHHPDLLTKIRTPLREREPRLEHPNFYFLQEDWLKAQQDSWGLTVWRPTVVYGDAPGVNMNALRGIAVYAALERAAGKERLDYPGGTYDQRSRKPSMSTCWPRHWPGLYAAKAPATAFSTSPTETRSPGGTLGPRCVARSGWNPASILAGALG
jgi:hypothetical protein